MRARSTIAMAAAASIAATVVLAGCGGPALPPGAVEAAPPEAPGLDTEAGVVAFYDNACSGCHGADGWHGAARPLADPLWWRTMPDAQIVEATAVGLGRLMPGFSRDAKGGPYIAYADLDRADIETFVAGLRRRWGSAGEGDAAAAGSAVRLGDATRGAELFSAHCISCHAEGSRDSVLNPFYLANVTDQGLWSAVVFGRPDLGKAPSSLAPEEIADLVAFMASRRPTWASATALDPPLPRTPEPSDATNTEETQP